MTREGTLRNGRSLPHRGGVEERAEVEEKKGNTENSNGVSSKEYQIDGEEQSGDS